MSEIMQNRRPKAHKGSNYSEGRLKLSTSCDECHRRKQKCDQQQPCRNCARRYPPPPCVYRTYRGVPNDASAKSEVETREVAHSSNSRPESLFQVSPSENTFSEWLQDEIEPTSLSIATLHNFDPNSYQNLLSSMVSQISSSVLVCNIESRTAFHDSIDNLERQLDFPSRDPVIAEIHARDLQRRPRKEGHLLSTGAFSFGSVNPLHFLGITPTFQSSELLQAFLKVITKYVVTIDGNPFPNYYNDHWVPWAVKSPLLCYLGIFTAACYQAEALKVPPSQSAVVLRYKCQVLSLLNKMISHKQTSTSAEVIAGVVFLATNEWYWSNFENCKAHLKGLKEMVRLRGGLDELGMNGFIRKMILLLDYHISCSYNCELTFPHEIRMPQYYPLHMSTPFVASEAGFRDSATQLQLGQETATILDDMGFLISATLQQIDREPSNNELKKLATTSTWTRDRIASLPDGSEPDDPLAHDHIYKSCRIASLIYCKAIVDRTTLVKSCSLSDLNNLWANMWRIKLSRWKQIPGIFLFIIMAATPAAEKTPHGRFLKSMLKTTSSYISMDHWDIADSSLMAFVKLQRWLRNDLVDVVTVGKQPALEFLHIYGE